MTVNKLHKLLGELIAQGYGRQRVCVDKPSFRDNRESDGCVVLEVCDAQLRTYNLMDGDGAHALRADGTERMLTSLVLDGGCGSSFNGDGNAR